MSGEALEKAIEIANKLMRKDKVWAEQLKPQMKHKNKAGQFFWLAVLKTTNI